MLNMIILIGRLTRDPEMRFTTSGKEVTNFTLAVDRGWGENNETDFIDVVVWGKQAEPVAQHLKKGRLAGVQGRLQIRQYEHEGQRRRAAEVVAHRVLFLDRGSKQGDTDFSMDNLDLGGTLAHDDIPF